MAATTSKAPTSASADSTVCVVLQQCLSAKLQLNASDGKSPQDLPVYVETGQGLVVFISFKKGCCSDILSKVSKSVLEAKLSYDGERLSSVLDGGKDILIVPQASIGGKLKGKSVQYHDLVAKDEGQVLYNVFVQRCKIPCEVVVVLSPDSLAIKQEELAAAGPSKVFAGTYGNRQVLSMDTNGPFTHVFYF